MYSINSIDSVFNLVFSLVPIIAIIVRSEVAIIAIILK